eukprot:2016941-Amphidinium_carterae.2
MHYFHGIDEFDLNVAASHGRLAAVCRKWIMDGRSQLGTQWGDSCIVAHNDLPWRQKSAACLVASSSFALACLFRCACLLRTACDGAAQPRFSQRSCSLSSSSHQLPSQQLLSAARRLACSLRLLHRVAAVSGLYAGSCSQLRQHEVPFAYDTTAAAGAVYVGNHHGHARPWAAANSHFFPIDELQHSLQLAEPAVRLANRQRIRRLACKTLAGYTPPSLHSLHQLSVVTSWLDLDERVMQAENMSRAWESVAELSDTAYHQVSCNNASSLTGLRGLAHCALQGWTTLAVSRSNATEGPALPPASLCADPEDYLPLTEFASHPDTPPHLLVDPEEEVAPTQLDVLLATLPVSDSDNATLDYNNGPLVQQGILHLHANMHPTRTTDDDPISQFSSDAESQVASLLQRGFLVWQHAPEPTASPSWVQSWEQFAPQL